jgi:hypothetical protein
LKKIKYLTIQFNNEIEPWELPAFRGAVIAKAGNDHILFHNHLNDREFLYGYPVIQYKRIGKCPMLVCLDYGTDEVHHFFSSGNLSVKIGEREVKLEVGKLNMDQINLQVWEKTFNFRIRNWIALNQENYQKYAGIKDELSKTEFLEGILKANIISFAKGVKWDIDKQISLRIDKIVSEKQVPYKKIRLSGFDIEFRTNVFLPDFVGLGKGVSLGFGTVTIVREK